MSATRTFDDCGCCAGLEDRTPAPLFNRPGLRQIAYRAGMYGLFKQSMLAGLSRADRPALAGLRTRDDGDLSIALLDAWAVAADVLTFYIERTAQEHYLPTATERRSAGDLVRLIGYRLLPGIAATTWLAFTLETAPDAAAGFRPAPTPGVPDRAPIAERTRVQSIPGPGELPQTFETVEAIEALAEWNALQPRLTAPRVPRDGDVAAWFAGVGLDVNPGDVLLFVAADWDAADPNDRWAQRRVVAVQPDPGTQRTLVRWGSPLDDLAVADPPVEVSVFALRQRAALFGYNAPDPQLFTDEVQGHLDLEGGDWDFAAISGSTLSLDALYRGIEPGSWVVLRRSGSSDVLAQITNVGEESKSAYSLSAKVTRLVVDRANADLTVFGDQNTRGTNIRLDSDPLTLAEAPVDEPVAGDVIDLAHDLGAIAAPRAIAVRGRRAAAHRDAGHDLTIVADDGAVRLPAADDALVVLSRETDPEGLPGQHRWRLRTPDGFEGFATDVPEALVFQPAAADAEVVGEVAIAAAVQTSDGLATLALDPPLVNVYDRTTAEILGNIARATHGETVEREVLGSGDGSKPYQEFTLRKDPLTWTRGTTPGTVESSLEVWVNGVRWHEAPSFFGRGPRDRVYVTQTTDDGKTVVQFGDGASGARLPTGQDNVVATYRHGAGSDGEVDAGQISLLMTRPLGVRGVTNPFAPEGAADPQATDDARENAPRSVLTLGRIVSLRDYEDFARGFVGIEKAQAVWTWDGERRGVLVTVAGVDGEDVPDGGLVHTDLVAAMAAAGSPRVPFVVRTYRPATFRLHAALRLDPDRDAGAVLAAVRAMLAERFAFASRAFGQMVTLSEAYAAIQTVSGVVAVDIDHLYRGLDARLDPFLVAEAPVDGNPPETAAAELLTIDPASLDDLEVRA